MYCSTLYWYADLTLPGNITLPVHKYDSISLTLKVLSV